ncbi:MAG: tetratricopeptide repeat protein [Rhizobiaceae bacterium]|nr:tetratricopeptide repeat protein [Rhizobiaceae bacterium]
MRIDQFGLALSTESDVAVRSFESAVYGVAAHQPHAGKALGESLSADPDCPGVLVLKGFANLVLAREELLPTAAGALGSAKRAVAMRGGGTRDERVMIEALDQAVGGAFETAADTLDVGFHDRPTTFLPFKISHSLRFMIGDATGMMKASRRMLETWTADDPAAGFLLGCHAFALEEHGMYEEAESTGRKAVAIQPEDAWGHHAVGHVFEMRGDTAAGIDWLERGRSDWSRCNNFSFHMSWHLALLHLERGDHETVLAVYDREVRPVQTDDFRDVANAVSLLWRLERSGVDVGDRWDDLTEVVRRRRTDTTLVFATLHTLLALVAIGDEKGAADLLAALEAKSLGTCDQSRVAAEIGLPLARVVMGSRGRRDGSTLDRLLRDIPKIGGSNAQRDVFVLALAEAAGSRGDDVAFSRIRGARLRLKAEDRLIEAVEHHHTIMPDGQSISH